MEIDINIQCRTTKFPLFKSLISPLLGVFCCMSKVFTARGVGCEFYKLFMMTTQPCIFYLFSKLSSFIPETVILFSVVVVVVFFNRMYPYFVDANVFPPHMYQLPEALLFQHLWDIMLELWRKIRQVCAFATKPCLIYGNSNLILSFSPVHQSQLSDLSPTMLKLEYLAVPIAQT